MAITTGAILSTAAVIGTAAATVGTVSQYNQQKANAKAEEEQATYNSQIESMAARESEAVALENARRSQEASSSFMASQRAAFGKSGAGILAGSPLAVLGAAAGKQQRKIQDIHQQGYWESQKHANASKMYKYQVGVAKASSPSALSLGLNLAGTLASGTGNVVSGYMSGKNYNIQKNGK